jgi:hypothetical protein
MRSRMERQSLRQIRGATELITDAVESTTNATAKTHVAIAAGAYGVLAQVRFIARPVQMIQQAQSTITTGVYHVILTANRIARVASAHALDRLEAKDRS